MNYCTTVDVDVDVDLDVDEIIEGLSADERIELLGKLLGSGLAPTSVGIGETNRIIEAAFLATKSMPKVPRELADLFWHVHGRALT